jgi:hypothetical protein
MEVPVTRREDRFNAGFDHARRGGKLDRIEYLRLSFRIGYRAAKFYLRAQRRRQTMVEMPMCFKVVTRFNGFKSDEPL